MTLREVSAEARVSLGYISEIERGQKEASSELLASLCAALDLPLSDVLREVSDAVAVEEARRSRPPRSGHPARRRRGRLRRLRRLTAMKVPTGTYCLGDAVNDGTGLTQEELGWLIAAAAVASDLLVGVRAVDRVSRLWTPSGGRS